MPIRVLIVADGRITFGLTPSTNATDPNFYFGISEFQKNLIGSQTPAITFDTAHRSGSIYDTDSSGQVEQQNPTAKFPGYVFFDGSSSPARSIITTCCGCLAMRDTMDTPIPATLRLN